MEEESGFDNFLAWEDIDNHIVNSDLTVEVKVEILKMTGFGKNARHQVLCLKNVPCAPIFLFQSSLFRKIRRISFGNSFMENLQLMVENLQLMMILSLKSFNWQIYHCTKTTISASVQFGKKFEEQVSL
ncbi:hypothetical protein L3Y34_018389 [Caenorhabditis briggsae]|uniref:MATH domain-containing protein n=1 Tax=Caenorhabditis briggsae TaxID=6238 RepID=A0AAE9IUK1_CAEBR|nr:hypothetical protein L3Y34_018389 [Caenorhabditis briggsae]